jgi:hypothetical protein
MNPARRLTAFVAATLLVIPAFAVGAQTPPAPDVLVVGGTPAGIAAALAAARSGAMVELVAASPQLGGVLSDAMMDQWDLNLDDDGTPIQGGIFREIHARLGDVFTSAEVTSVFRSLLAAQPRIRVRTDAQPLAVTTEWEGDKRSVTAVRFHDNRDDENFTVAAPEIVDATDDADVAALAGARYDLGRQDTGRDARMQPVTLMFTVNGVDWDRLADNYDEARDGPGGASAHRAWGYSTILRAYRPLGDAVLVRDLNLGHEDDGAVTVNAIDVLGINGLDEADLERARAISEREAPALVAWLRTRVPGFAEASIGRYADAVYVRETRHIAGLDRLTADDVWGGRISADAIGLSSYPLDLHPTTRDERLAYAAVRHVYGIPFGALVPRDLVNVVLASPAISATHLASGSARIIPTTVEEGEAAGSAAALADQHHLTFAQIDDTPSLFGTLRGNLAREGAILQLAKTAVARA